MTEEEDDDDDEQFFYHTILLHYFVTVLFSCSGFNAATVLQSVANGEIPLTVVGGSLVSGSLYDVPSELCRHLLMSYNIRT